jgi:hypothetical protein
LFAFKANPLAMPAWKKGSTVVDIAGDGVAAGGNDLAWNKMGLSEQGKTGEKQGCGKGDSAGHVLRNYLRSVNVTSPSRFIQPSQFGFNCRILYI